MRSRPLVALTLLALMGLSTATSVSAQSGSSTFETLEVTLLPSNFTIELKRTVVSGQEASDQRFRMDDEYGNANDIVEPAEAQAYAADWLAATNQQLRQFEAFKPWAQIQVDGRPSKSVRVTDIVITGAEGLTESTTPYSVDFHAYMAFPEVSKDPVQVRFGQEFVLPKLYYNTANFTAGDGWHIRHDPARAEFWDGTRYHYAFEQVEEFSSGSDPHFFNLSTEAPEEGGKKKKDSPAVTLPLVLVATALLVAASRRR